jgi:hypothetical protein
VDDVLARQVHQHRPVDRQVQVVDVGDVVLGIGIRPIQPERIVGGHQLDVGAAEPAVRARVLHVPRELLADDAYHGRFAFRRELSDPCRPGGDGVKEEQGDFDDRHGNLGRLGDLALRARVVGLRVGAAPEADEDEQEERAPADEQHQHQPVHQDGHLIDVGSVRRCRGRHPEIFKHYAVSPTARCRSG